MGFNEAVDGLNAAQLAAFGQTVAYTVHGSTPVEIRAIVSIHKDIDDARWNAAVQATAEMWVKASDIPSPGYKDTVAIGTDVWTVVNIDRGVNSSMWKLDLRRDLRPTFRK